MSVPRAMGGFAAAAVLSIAGCTDINGSADHVASLEFSTLPYPAVVAGDTLRDSLGVVTPLHALAHNGSGSEIAGAEISYIALDTGVTITPAGLVIATRRSGAIPIIASTSALQTRSVPLTIARAPDSVAFNKAARDTINYDAGLPGANTDVTDPLEVKVITRDTTGGVTGTQGWLVSFQVSFRNAIIARADTSSLMYLDDGSTRRTVLDTTATGGIASRRLHLGLAYSATGPDSVFVTATVRHKGQQVRGSPLRFVILLRPK